ncbi:pyridoxal 4-dehydrogenase [Francisella halioticida]|uniref:Pyridoxal 4-dehydrogenase n=1 Tax=Francisella halioticida TaxID=549298 RepID=A0ABN5AZ05_9GAMM|nr:aldo/keto reductase [Francisella halioticida]ASG68765.1 pyridoxal 4-dehydrogenase [Francisella halioticida]
MNYRKLGKLPLTVSEIGFGGAPIGNLYTSVSNDQVTSVIDSAWEQGVRYFDTAPQYGHGLSEHRLGYNLYKYPRDEFVLSTKVGKVLTPARGNFKTDEEWFVNPLPNEIHYDYSYTGFMRSIEGSLQRLGVNYLDIVHIHDLDRIVLGSDFERQFAITMRSGYKALEELKNQGIIKAISLGVKQWQVCDQALQQADFDCFMLQGSYTLLDQSAKEFLNTCFQKQIAVLQARPFESGILATGIHKDMKYNYISPDENIQKKVMEIQKLCTKYNLAINAVALAFPLRHPSMASVVTGMRQSSELRNNIEAYQKLIPIGLWQDLNEILI